MQKNIYDEKFYIEQRHESLNSAKHIIPLVIDLVKPKSVVDFGCGTGTWLSVFEENDIKDILGIDGDYVNIDMLLINKEKFLGKDLSQFIDIGRKYDLAVCLEVAEHIEEEFSDNIIESLVHSSNVILFSAAIPYQGGKDHRNEQWLQYWVEKFKNKGYIFVDCIRNKIWNDKQIAFYYAQNIFLVINEKLVNSNNDFKKLYDLNKCNIYNCIHPKMYMEKVMAYEFSNMNILSLLYSNKLYDIILNNFEETNEPSILFYKGRSYKNINKYEESLYYLKYFLNNIETNKFKEYDRYKASAYFHIGEIYFEMKKFNKAKAFFEKCQEIYKGNNQKANYYLKEINKSI